MALAVKLNKYLLNEFELFHKKHLIKQYNIELEMEHPGFRWENTFIFFLEFEVLECLLIKYDLFICLKKLMS